VFSIAWHVTAKLETWSDILTERREIVYVSEDIWSWKGKT